MSSSARGEVAGQVVGLGAQEVGLEAEAVVVLAPVLGGQEGQGHARVIERRLVGGGLLRPLPGQEVDLGEEPPLVGCRQEIASLVQVVHDLEDRFPDVGTPLQEEPADPQVRGARLAGRDLRVGRLLDPVVEEAEGHVERLVARVHHGQEPVAVVEGDDEPLLHERPQRAGRLRRVLPRDEGEGPEVEVVAEARGQPQHLLAVRGQGADLARHELDDVVGDAPLADLVGVGPPRAGGGVEPQQTALVERLQELVHEEGVPAGLGVDEPGEAPGVGLVPVGRVAEELGEVVERQGPQVDARGASPPPAAPRPA